MFRTKVTFFDILAVLCVLLCAVLLLWSPWQSREDGAFLVVTTPDSDERYPLSENRELTLEVGEHVLQIVIRDGEAFVAQSSCADGICVSSGRISRVGQTVICAPAGVRLLIKGGDTDVDHVAG